MASDGCSGSGAGRCAEGMVDSRQFLTQSVGRWLHRRSSNDTVLPARLLTTLMVINPALDFAIAAKARVHELTTLRQFPWVFPA